MFWIVLEYAFAILMVITALFYAVFEMRLFCALGKVHLGNSIRNPLPSVSILVSARNEEAGISKTLDSLMKQLYKGRWDIWIADDRSTDRTPQILAEYDEKYPDRIHVVTISELAPGESAKKNAIAKLVAASEGEILLLTDADCIVQPTWIRAMIREFEPGIDFVAGHSYIELPTDRTNWLLNMQAVETMAYRIAGTGALAMGTPITSTGNNLAYRRSFFEEVHGFEGVSKIQSGDDDLLLQKLAREAPWKAHYSIDPEAFVTTQGKETLPELWEQRKRWASKTTYYAPKIVALLVAVFIFFCLISLGYVLSFFSFNIFLATLFGVLVKLVGDSLVELRGLRIFQQKQLFKWFLPVEIIHAPFTVFAVLFGIAGHFKWKG
ncbi:MAG: glycosyltransferase [Fibrobacter sp.]|nr:glycosyltransferase [Fibrobacter sp.]